MKQATRFIKKFNFCVAGISAFSVVVMMLVTVVDVFSRKAFLVGLRGVNEYVSFCLCMTILGAMAYTESEDGHLKITLLLGFMPAKVKFTVLSLMNLLNTAVSGVLAYGILAQAVKLSNTPTSGILTNIPYYPFYFICGSCCVIFSLTCLFSTLRSAIAIGNKEMAEEIQSHWSG